MENLEFLTIYLNKWKRKKPILWSKIDSFCWLYDWSIRNNVEFVKLEKLYEKLPNGKNLCNSNLEYFTNCSEIYGLHIFEDLHILLSSYLKMTKKINKTEI